MAQGPALHNLPLEVTPPVEYARRWYGDDPFAPPSHEDVAAVEAFNQAVGAVALAFNYDPLDPTDRRLLDVKVRRLRLLSLDPGVVDPTDLALAEETAVDLVYASWGKASHEDSTRTLSRLAYHDPLTGAQNRHGENRIMQIWTRPDGERRHGEGRMNPRRRARIDIDMTNFKQINDLLGHRIGDLALVEAVKELDDLSRDADAPETVRMGGDEFSELIESISEGGFRAVLGRIKEAQNAKVRTNRNKQAWFLIGAERSVSQASGGPFKPEIRLKDPQKPDSERLLFINGRLIAPFRDIVVYAVGGSHGQVTSERGFRTLERRAQVDMELHKASLHDAMGGAYRPTPILTGRPEHDAFLAQLEQNGQTRLF